MNRIASGRREERRAAQAIASQTCPLCAAPPGVRCVDDGDQDGVHHARKTAVRAAARAARTDPAAQ